MTASRYQLMTREFHNAMGSQYGWKAKELRQALIREEADEVLLAVKQSDPIGFIDGMCDLLYVVYGTADILDLEVDTGGIENTVPSIVIGMELIAGTMREFEIAVKRVLEALEDGDAEKLKGYMDNLCVGCWASCIEGLGIDAPAFFEEVHRSNMLKKGGTRAANGKILKPAGWQPPRIADMYAKRQGKSVPKDTP